MKVVRRDKTYHKEKLDVQRSIDMAIDRLKERLQYYNDQNIEIGKVFGDDILIHDIINKYYYVYKCRVNQMQIRILYTVKDNKLIIISHWYKNRTNNDYIKYFKEVTAPFRCRC
jgi:hypothetical protein